MIPSVLLIQADNVFEKKDISKIYDVPVQLLFLGSAVKAALGCPVKIVDLRNYQFYIPQYGPEAYKQIEKNVQTILAPYMADTKYFGISVYGSQDFIFSYSIAKIIKAMKKESVVIAGGFHPTFRPDDFLHDPQSPFDLLLCGEADLTLATTIRQVENGQIHLDSQKHVPKVIDVEPVVSLDILPMIDWSLYAFPPNSEDAMFRIFYYSSRGCPFSCHFCCAPLQFQAYHGKAWRPMAISHVMTDIHNALDYFSPRKTNLLFYEPIFGLNHQWKLQMLEKLVEAQIEVPIFYEERVDTFHKEDVNLLKKLKKVMISYGLESGSPQMLMNYNKTPNPLAYLKKMEEITNIMEKNQIFYKVNFIFAGPGETQDTLQESLDYFDKLFQNSEYGILLARDFILYPGTQIYANEPIYHAKFGTTFNYPNWYLTPFDPFFTNFIHPSKHYRYSDCIQKLYAWGERFYTELFEHTNKSSENPIIIQIFLNLLGNIKKNPQLKRLVLKEFAPTREVIEQLTEQFWKNHFNLNYKTAFSVC